MITTNYDPELDRMLMIRHGGGVRRYHTWPVVGEQTVASHSWGVATILLALEPNISSYALAAALHHDVAEGFTGDMPATAKWANADLDADLRRAEERINSEYNINFAEVLDNHERTMVRIADMLDLMFFALEQRMVGNQRMDVVMQNGYDWMHTNVPRGQSPGMDKARSWAQHICLAYVVKAGGRVEIKDN